MLLLHIRTVKRTRLIGQHKSGIAYYARIARLKGKVSIDGREEGKQSMTMTSRNDLVNILTKFYPNPISLQ